MKLTSEDYRRISHIYFTAYRFAVKKTYPLFVYYILFFMRLVYSVLKWQFHYKKFDEILVLAPSLNNCHSLRPIWEKLPSDSYVVWDKFSKDVPYARIYFRSILHLNSFYRFYKSLSLEDKQLVKTFCVDFMILGGTYDIVDDILKKNPQLRIMLFSNDHFIMCRCFIELTKKYKVKTIYAQHASVSDKFPPLQFSYSFLDGMESAEKYLSVGNNIGEILLSGSPRFDSVQKVINFNNNNAIGIAVNECDDINKIAELCEYLKDTIPMTVIVRPHPLMEASFNYDKLKKFGVEFSYPSKERSFDYIKKLKLMVANDSAIHLDSAIQGIPSVVYNFTDGDVVDYYGYIKKGLVEYCENKESLRGFLTKTISLPVDKIRYYNASFMTKYDGHIGEMIANFIISLMKGSAEEWIGKNFHSENNMWVFNDENK